MSKKTAFELIEEVMRNNWELMRIVQTLKPEDQLIYLPKVRKQIDETHELLDNMTKKDCDDIPKELFVSSKAN